MLKSETAGSSKGITYGFRSSGKLKSSRAGFIIIILLLSSCLSLVVGTNTVAADQDGDYIYTVSGGVATITGYTGAGGDIAIPSTLGGYPVVAIGDNAFFYCDTLTSVAMGISVTTIGNSAFSECTALTSVTLGNGVNSIGDFAFYYCYALTSVVIPDSVTTIGNSAFSECYALPSVTIGNGVTTIGNSAFALCTNLASVAIGNGVTTIGNSAFFRCYALTSVIIPDSVTTIGNSAFYYCTALTSVTIGNGVTTIGGYAFADCTALTSVTFYGLTAPTSVGAYWVYNTDPGIQGHAYAASDFPAPGEYFYGLLMGAVIPFDYTFTVSGGVATITGYLGAGGDITIPSTLGGYPVVAIGYGAFDSCDTLTSVVIPDSITTIGDLAFCYCLGLTSVTIPDSVTSIGHWAFYHCSALTSVIIPDSVTTVGNLAFCYCYALTSVTIGNGVITIGDSAFFDCTALTSVAMGISVTTIGNSAFYYCVALTSVVIPDSVTTIGNSAFRECYALTSMTIGNGVITIGDLAFCDCVALTSVVIPDNVTTIGNSAFRECTALTSMTIGNGVITIGDYAFCDCIALTSVTIGDGVTTIGSMAFYHCTALTSVTIGNGVTTIGNAAFANCYDLTSVAMGISVTTIGNAAFADCYDLTSITFYGLTAPTSVGEQWIVLTASGIQGHAYAFSDFPAPGEYFYGLLMGAVIPCDYIFTVSGGVATITGYTGAGGDITIPSTLGGCPVVAIGNNAFESCTVITSVIIPDSVTSIGEGAFYYCTVLTSVAIPDSVTSIGNWAFQSCYALTSVVIPDSVTSIGDYAFCYCYVLTSMVVPDGVTSIAEGTFYYCYGLTSLVIPDSVTSIGDYAISYCYGLTSLVIPDSVIVIGDHAFIGCLGLTSLVIPDSVITIGHFAFGNCQALTSVVIGSGVTSIGDRAFSDCYALTSVVIGSGVTSIGDYAFLSCGVLTSVTFYGLIAPTSVGAMWIYGTAPGIQGHAYAFSDFPAPGEYFYGLLMGAVIPCDYIFTVSGGVATITGYTGAGGDITIPSTLGGCAVVAIGDSAFAFCGTLTSVVIPGSVATIGDSAFLSCTALTSVVIPDSVETIGDYAFGKCWALTSVVIPDSVTTIGSWAFADCTALTSGTIGKRVTTIGDSAFFDCTVLTSVTFYGLTAPTSVGADWIDNTAPGIQGHAYFASDFPGPGEYFFGLLMGGYIDGPQAAVISFSQNGVGVSAPDVVLTVDGSPYLSGQLPVSFTWSIGTHHVFSWSSEVYDGSGTRHQWLYSSGLSSAQSGTIIVLRDGSIAAFYSTEYLVSFGQSGLGEDATGTVVTVDGLPLTYGDLPYSTWVGNGETIEYCHEAVVSSGTDTDYVLTSVVGPSSPITVVDPVTVVGSYVLGETGPPKEKTGSYVFYPLSDGWWRAQVVNDGLRSIYLTVIDVEYIPGSEPDLAERVNFMKLDCYPVGTAYSSSVYMLAGHGYNISITPYGDGSVHVTDEFTPDTEASSLSVSLLGVVGASSGVLLFAMVFLGPYLLTRTGKMSSRELPVPSVTRRTSVKKVRVLRGMTDRDRSS